MSAPARVTSASPIGQLRPRQLDARRGCSVAKAIAGAAFNGPAKGVARRCALAAQGGRPAGRLGARS